VIIEHENSANVCNNNATQLMVIGGREADFRAILVEVNRRSKNRLAAVVDPETGDGIVSDPAPKDVYSVSRIDLEGEQAGGGPTGTASRE
jgi:hypothetical protein